MNKTNIRTRDILHVNTTSGKETALDTLLDNAVTSAEDILPEQSGKNGYVLSTNGTNVLWQEPLFVRNADGDITTFGDQSTNSLNESLETFIQGN